MDPAVATEQIRVAIIGDGAGVDLALPTTLAIRELIPRIRSTLASGRDDDELVPDNTHKDGLRPYSLAPLGGTPFSLDATLEALGIDDGEQLLLCKLPPGPAAPPVVENIADASAIHSANQSKAFEHTMLRTTAQVVVLTLGALVCSLAAYSWHRGYNIWAAAALGALTVIFMTSTFSLYRRGPRGAAGRMGVATTVPLALSAAAAVPGDAAAPRVFLAAALLVAWSLLLLTVTSSWVATHTAILVISATMVAATGVRILGHLPYLTLGCGVLGVSLLLANSAPTVSAMWARFPLPNVPAPGEPIPAPLSLAEIEDLPRKTATCNSYQNALIAASVLLSVIGSVLVVWLPTAPALMAWWLVVVTATVGVLRMRIWDSATPALWFLAAPFLTAATLCVSFAATGHLIAGVYAAAVAVGLTVMLLVAAAIKPRELSTLQRRCLDVFEGTLLITILPAMLWLTGLISLIRNRGAL